MAGLELQPMDRRKFLKRVGTAVVGTAAGGAGVYPFLEAKWCRVVRRTIALPNLPPPFQGVTVALLADVHHGPFVPLAYIRHVVAMTNALKPDIIALAGDYVHRHQRTSHRGSTSWASSEPDSGDSRFGATTTTGNFEPLTRLLSPRRSSPI